MDEALWEAIYSATYHIEDERFEPLDIEVFEQVLNEQGYMIVPIEDPTNLRFGVDE